MYLKECLLSSDIDFVMSNLDFEVLMVPTINLMLLEFYFLQIRMLLITLIGKVATLYFALI